MAVAPRRGAETDVKAPLNWADERGRWVFEGEVLLQRRWVSARR